MATGTGKTFTALGGLCRLSKSVHEQLGVIIIAPYQHLVEQWVEDIIKFNVNPIIAYAKNTRWKQEFSNIVKAYNLDIKKNFCIITTNATFIKKDFQSILQEIKRDFCLVADEAHNMGAENISLKLPEEAKYRLALSATIERANDPEGTEKIYDYFGKNTCIHFTIKEAINNNFLTPYYYHPVPVYLSEDELVDYSELTKDIIRLSHNGDLEFRKGSRLELLTIKRAKIIAGCREKVPKLIEIITPFKNDSNMLIYCGATSYDSGVPDDSDVKQIDEVVLRLAKELEMSVCKFTASEDIKRRIEIKNCFSSKTIQAIVAIKCLDEGVNIPEIEKAFVLASSSNPKEYIQRRGRILRKAKNKKRAYIYDFITLPRRLEEVRNCNDEELKYDSHLIRHEIERMNYFADSSQNSYEASELVMRINNAYGKLY